MRTPWLILPLMFLFAAQARGDSVTLVTGEKITGTIKAETAAEITIDVPISNSITDERVLRKEDISKIDREQPDEIAYKQLIQIQPSTELSYASQTYEQILAQLTAFQTTYPTSAYLPEIKQLATSFQDEKKRVDAGQIKYLGQWLAPDEAARRRIQIVALEIYNSMQQQAAAGDLVGAMQTFDSIERGYGGTRAYVSAVTLAQQVLPRLEQDLAARMESVKADQVQLNNTIKYTPEPERSSIIAAAKLEQDRASAAVAAAIASGAKWVPLIPRSQVSIDTLQKTATSEAQRISSLPVATMTASIQKVDEARTAFAGGDFKTADGLLKDASQEWTNNEAAHYWTDRLKEKMAASSPTPTLTPHAATPKPLPSVPRPSPLAVNPAPVAVAEPDKPYYMTVSGATTIAIAVLVVGGIIASINKRKANKEAPE